MAPFIVQGFVAQWDRWLSQRRRPPAGDDFGLGLDCILAYATLYWLTGTAGSSMRIDATASGDLDVGHGRVPAGVSVFGCGDFASRAASVPENDLVAWYPHDTGGHIASLDAPDEFVGDLTDFIDRIGVQA